MSHNTNSTMKKVDSSSQKMKKADSSSLKIKKVDSSSQKMKKSDSQTSKGSSSAAPGPQISAVPTATIVSKEELPQITKEPQQQQQQQHQLQTVNKELLHHHHPHHNKGPASAVASFVQSSFTGKETEATVVTQKEPVTAKVDILCPAVRRMGYSAEADTVGEGAFSRVFRARSTRVLNKDIAVKIVRVDDPKIPVAWKEYSMKRELKILKRVRHPNVITIYDVIKTRTRIYIFMDLAAASVASHLEATEEPASEQTARNWFGGISNALAYLHQIEIAHRDLKNDNILIDSNGQAKLTDFGFACFTYDRRKRSAILSNTSCGTKAYVAPEVFNPPYNAKHADVWSLGICMYESVTLLQPFRDDLPTHMFVRRQMEKGLVIPKRFQASLNDLFQDLLKKMIEPDVNKRIRSEAVLIHPWMRMPRR